MPNVRNTRYYEYFDMPEPAKEHQVQQVQSAGKEQPAQAVSGKGESPAGRNQLLSEPPDTDENQNQPQTELQAFADEQLETPEETNDMLSAPSSQSSESESEQQAPETMRGELVYDVSSDDFAPEDSRGEIAVQAVTARGTRPVPEAAVIIYKNRSGENEVVSFYLTDADGKTPNISVPAPSKADSQSPSDTLPFADYNIAVRHPMYYTAMIDNVQVFGSELTIQTVEMIPLPEFVNERNTTKTVVIPKQNL